MKSFVLVMGLSGSGKSYFAKMLTKNLSDAIVLSSDALRKEYYGDESVQDNPAFIFEQMRIRTLEALKEGGEDRTVVYDATNLSSKRRKGLLAQLPRNVRKICHCIITPLEQCIENDKTRNRHVSEHIIMKQLTRFEVPWYNEGWDTITIQKNYGDAPLTVNLDVKHDCPKYHKDDTIKAHLMRVERAVASNLSIKQEDKNILLEVARFHDIGKPYTKTFYNTKGELSDNAHYYQHENVGAYLYMVSFVKDKYFTNEEIYSNDLFIAFLINNHMILWNNQKKYNSLNEHTKYLLKIFTDCDREGA